MFADHPVGGALAAYDDVDDVDDVLVVGAGDVVRVMPSAAGLPVEAAIDGGPLRPVDSIRSPTEAGMHWLTTASRNESGKVSPLRWIRLLVDDAGPAMTLEITPSPVTDSAGKAWIPPAAQARAWATDRPAGVARLTLSVNGARSEEEGAEIELTLPDEGAVTLSVEAVDKVGNRSHQTSLDLRVDAQAPVGLIRVEGPQVEADQGLVLGPAARLIAEIEDAESGVAAWTALAGGEVVSHERWRGSWPPGANVASLRARDRVGNERTLSPLSFVVDEQAPTLSWHVAEGATNDAGKRYHRRPVTVTVQATDKVAGVATIERRSAGAWIAVPETMTVDGTSLDLRASDRVGNQAVARATWLVDDAPPTLALRDSKGKIVAADVVVSARVGDRLTVAVADNGVGVATATYRLNHRAVPGRPAMRPLEEEQVLLEISGNYVLLIEARDRLGHLAAASWRIEVAGRK